MKELVIIGARGFGREVYDLAISTTEYLGGEFRVKGFLDDKEDALDAYTGYPPILGPVETYEVSENDVFACALGYVEPKKKYAEVILAKGGRFINLIHPLASIRTLTGQAKGLLIFPYVFVSVDVHLGDFVTLQHYACLGHDCSIGHWSHLGSYCNVGGFAKIEDEVMLQTKSTIVPKKTVGQGAMVGAASLVLKNVKPGSSVFGVPALEI